MKQKILLIIVFGFSVLFSYAQDRPEAKPFEYPFADGDEDTRGVYGDDDRKEVTEIGWTKDYARATAVMIKKDKIVGNKVYAPSLRQQLSKYYGINKFDANVKFLDQPVAASCTGFLIAPDILVTAGHCIETMEDAKDFVWVFDYTQDNNYNASSGYLTIDPNNVYEVSEVLDALLYNGKTTNSDGQVIEQKYDYSFLKLNRESDRKPYRFRTGGSVNKYASMYTIGCPTGLPLKLTDNAYVVENEVDEWFKTNIDGFPGNSGGPVFDANGFIEGIHVRGSRTYSTIEEAWKGDYIYDEDCRCIKTVVWESATGDGKSWKEYIIGSQEHRIGYYEKANLLNSALYSNVDYAIRKKDQERLEYWLVYKWIVDKDYTEATGRFEFTAAKNGNLEALRTLIKISEKADLVDSKGNNLLFYAVDGGNAEMISYLVREGARINANNKAGQSPLLYALINGNSNMAKALIEKGANTNIVGNEGYTPLHYAVRNGSMDLVRVLVQKGADLNAKDAYGKTPFKLAKSQKQKSIKKYLKKAKKGKV